MIIAVDGPAGAGKSTVAKLLAQKMGLLYIDTGAMYRALTLKVLEKRIDINNIQAIIDLAHESTIDLINIPGGALKVMLDNRDVSKEIREPRIAKHVSDIAKIKGVRQVMVELQRRLGKIRDSVLDGRDIGTIVFPDADKKFYIDAKFPERANRRYKELTGLGQNITLQEVESDLSNRDRIDSTREVAPLRQAEDATYIDTTDMTIEEVVTTLLNHIGAPGR